MNLLSTVTHAACPAYGSIRTQKSCQEIPVKKPPCRDKLYQYSDFSDNFLAQLQQESLQKVEELQKDPDFQETIKRLQSNSYQSQNTAVNFSPETQSNLNETILYIFVSFSMREKALLNIAHEAKQFGATLVLRGFKQGSYLKTAQSLMKIILETGQGVIIDPELYSLFNITTIPTFVLAKPFQLYFQERIQTPLHDKLQGHVSTYYSLNTFADEGDLKDEAKALLRKGAAK